MSILLGGRGLGALVGPLVAARWAGQNDHRLRLGILFGYLTIALGYGLIGVARNVWMAAGCAMLAHAGGSTVWVFSTTLLQLRTEDRFRGRVFSADLGLASFTFATTAYLCGYFLDQGISARAMATGTGFFMRVVAVREHIEKEKPQGVKEVYPAAELGKVLSQSDFVVMAAPLIPATQGLINANTLGMMKPEAYLINVGRGPQVDEAALAEALRAHRIAGAALDVFEQEPLPGDSPLWSLENLLITPHTAGLTEKLWQRHYEHFSENLRRYLAHQPLHFVVEKSKGY